MAGFRLKLPDDLIWEAVREGGQRFGADNAGDLPVPDRGILAHALLLQPGKGARWCAYALTCAHAVDVKKAELAEIRAAEIGVGGDSAKSIGALIAKGCGIRLRADAEAVQNYQKNTFCHICFLRFPPGIKRRRSCDRLTTSPDVISASIISAGSVLCKAFLFTRAWAAIFWQFCKNHACPLVSITV